MPGFSSENIWQSSSEIQKTTSESDLKTKKDQLKIELGKTLDKLNNIRSNDKELDKNKVLAHIEAIYSDYQKQKTWLDTKDKNCLSLTRTALANMGIILAEKLETINNSQKGEVVGTISNIERLEFNRLLTKNRLAYRENNNNEQILGVMGLQSNPKDWRRLDKNTREMQAVNSWWTKLEDKIAIFSQRYNLIDNDLNAIKQMVVLLD